MRYRFLEFVVDTEQQALFGPEGLLPLRRQSYRVLLFLVERAPAVVSKAELLDAIWGHQAVSTTAVAQTIRELRELLNEDTSQPRAILTKHRMGYQFIAQLAVEPQPPGPTDSTLPFAVDHGFAGPKRIRRDRTEMLRLIAVGAALVVLGAAVAWHWPIGLGQRAEKPWTEEASRAAVEGMAAARVLNAKSAEAALGRARAVEDTPRTALFHARLLLSLGERLSATAVLDSVDTMPSPDARFDQQLAEAVRNEAAGRFAAALEGYRLLHQLVPDDLDVTLALFEMQVIERRHSAQQTYDVAAGDDRLPHARRLLMSAQLAGVMRNAERQLQQSTAAVAAADAAWTGLIGSADVEQARALLTLGQTDEASDVLSRAASTLEAAGLLRAAADARLLQIEPALVRGDLTSAAAELAELSRRMDAVGDSYTVGRLLHAQGRIALRSGNDEDAIAMFSAAAEQHQLGGNPDGVVSAYGAQSGALRRLGRRDEAAEILQRALVLAERSALGSARASIHGNLGNHLAEDGRLDEAQRHFEAALGLYRKLRDRRWEAVVLGSLGGVAAARGELRAADERYRQALAVFTELDLSPDIARIHYNMARLAVRNGDLAAAEEHVDEAMPRLEALGHGPRIGHALLVRAEILLLEADLEGAESALDRARETGDGDLTVLADADHLRGRIALLRDDTDTAQAAFESAMANHERTGRRAQAGAAALGLARVGLTRGKYAVIEQETSALASAASAEDRHGDEIAARLVRLHALVAQARTDEAEREAEALRALIDAAPEFEAEMEWSLLRAQLDLDPEDRRQRLRWALGQSQKYGQQLLSLRIQASLLNDLPAEDLDRWQDEIERRGLRSLHRMRFTIGR